MILGVQQSGILSVTQASGGTGTVDPALIARVTNLETKTSALPKKILFGTALTPPSQYAWNEAVIKIVKPVTVADDAAVAAAITAGDIEYVGDSAVSGAGIAPLAFDDVIEKDASVIYKGSHYIATAKIDPGPADDAAVAALIGAGTLTLVGAKDVNPPIPPAVPGKALTKDQQYTYGGLLYKAVEDIPALADDTAIQQAITDEKLVLVDAGATTPAKAPQEIDITADYEIDLALSTVWCINPKGADRLLTVKAPVADQIVIKNIGRRADRGALTMPSGERIRGGNTETFYRRDDDTYTALGI